MEKENNIEEKEIDINVIPRSKEEEDILIIFKEEIQKENLQYNSNIVDDNYLLRFLRARKLNIVKALVMFRLFIEWREKEDIDNISTFSFPEESKLKEIYPRGFHKTDKIGRPIHYEVLAKMNYSELLKFVTQDRMVKNNVKKMHYIYSTCFPSASKASGHNVHQIINVIDLKGFGMMKMSKKIYDYIKADSAVMQANFPETLGHILVVNCGYVLKGCWAIIKGFLDENTRNKVQFLWSYKELNKFVSFF
jgi:hypothetical protein